MTSAVKKLLFGTAGIPLSSCLSSTLAGIKRIAELELDCLEIEFVKGMKISSDMAQEIKETSLKHNVKLSTHAPYYVNFNSPEGGKRLLSQEWLLSTARMSEICGAESVVFHAGYYGRSTPEESFLAIKKGLLEVTSILKSERSSVIMRPETMGKRSQFGSLGEVLFLCREVDYLFPCLDFSHIHSREGKANSYDEFSRILGKVEKKLGREALKKLHIHISGTEYNEKGEMKHINLIESDFRFDDWIQVLKDFEVEGTVICESPNLEKDAAMLKKLFQSEK